GFLRVGLVIGRALERPQLHVNAYGLEIVDRGLGEIPVGAIAEKLAGVEPVWIAGFGEQRARLLRIVDRRRRLPIELEALWNDAVADARVAQGERLVDAAEVEREVRGAPHPHVVPRRLRIPLISEIEEERPDNEHRLEGQALGALQ